MTMSTNFHGVTGSAVDNYDDHDPPFATILATDAKGNKALLFFADLDAAESWLLEALGKAVDAKISDQAMRDADSAAVARFEAEGLAAFGSARIGEPLDLTAVDL